MNFEENGARKNKSTLPGFYDGTGIAVKYIKPTTPGF